MDSIKITEFSGNQINVNNGIVKSYSFPVLSKLFSKPIKGAKIDRYFVRGELDPVYRNDANLHSASLIVLDGDKAPDEGNAPPPAAVHDALKKHDINHFIYTTHSHSVEKNKWRALIPCKLPSKPYLKPTVSAVLAILEKEGCPIAHVPEMNTWSQPWFIPTRDNPDDGMFRHYEYIDGSDLIPVEPFDDENNLSMGTNVSRETEIAGNEARYASAISGKNYHQSHLTLAMQYAGLGLDKFEIQALMEGIHEKSVKRDKWEERMANIPGIARTAFDKFQKPQTIPVIDLPGDPFPMDCLPSNIVSAKEELCRCFFMPESYSALGALASISMALGNSEKMIIRGNSLWAYPNIVTVFVAPTGAYKSPFFSALNKPIREYEEGLKKKYVNRKSYIEAQNEQYRATEKREKNNFSDDASLDKRLIIKLATAKASIQEIPAVPVLYMQDATDEAMAYECFRQGGAISIGTSEGSEVFDLIAGKYRDGNFKGDVFVLKGVTSDEYKRSRMSDRQGNEFTIKEPVLSGMIFTQFDSVKELYSDEKLRGKGLLARYILLNSPIKIGERLIYDNSDIDLNIGKLNGLHNVVKELLDKRFKDYGDPSSLGRGSPIFEPSIVNMDKDCQNLWREIHNDDERSFKGKLNPYQEELNKLTTNKVKIARLLQQGDNRSGSLKAEYLEAANQLMNWQADEHIRQSNTVALSFEYEYSRSLLGWFTADENRFKRFSNGGFTKSSLRNALHGNKLIDGVDSALEILNMHKWLALKTKRYFVNFTMDQGLCESKKGEIA